MNIIEKEINIKKSDGYKAGHLLEDVVNYLYNDKGYDLGCLPLEKYRSYYEELGFTPFIYNDNDVYYHKIHKGDNMKTDEFLTGLKNIINEELNEERNLIPDLIAKYGDLTIPEFIDTLISEDNLNESLNEGYPQHSFPDITDYNHIPGFDMSSKYFVVHTDGLLECKANKKLSCKFEYKYLYTQTPNGFLIQLLLDQQRWKDTDNAQYDNLIIDVIRDYSKDVKHDRPSGASHYYYFVLKKFRLQELDKTVIETQFKQCMKELLDLMDSRYEQQNKSLEDEYELIDIKQTVKNKNIKVKQALTQQDIIDKIKSLQNPTPEQLAKILAAIE